MAEAGRTIVVRAGASVMVPSIGAPAVSGGSATQFGMKPRVRSGYALKRLDATEGPRRWVLKDEHTGKFLRLSDNDAWVFEQLDGTHSLIELIAMCEQRYGPPGPARLARLLSDLSERGFLAGRGERHADGARRRSGSGAGCSSRARRSSPGSGRRSRRSTARGGWVLFTRPVLYVLAALVVARAARRSST